MDTLLRRCRLRCLVRPTPQSQRSMQDYSQLLQTQWQQRIVHTHTFKIFEYGTGFTRPAELVVEEVGSMGHSCVRSLEHFFYGIVGHVKDKRGSPSTDGARPRGLPIIGAVALVYPKNTKLSRLKMRHLLRIEDTDASAIEALPPQPHIQVTQLAWILHDIWSQDTSMLPSCKPSQVLTQAQRRLPLPTQHFLNHAGLSHPSAHLAILANMMAPGNAASTEIPDDDSM